MAAGIASRHPTQTAAGGDVDNDGLLDLYASRLGLPNMLIAIRAEAPTGSGAFTR